MTAPVASVGGHMTAPVASVGGHMTAPVASGGGHMTAPVASRALATPIANGAIALLVINDHVLKAIYPGFVTGKLSDFAGLIFFPLLLAAALEQLGLRRGVQTIAIAVLVTGAFFAAIKLSMSAGDIYRVGLAALQWPFRALRAIVLGEGMPLMRPVQLCPDRSDLVALVALGVPIVLARRVLEEIEPDETEPDETEPDAAEPDEPDAAEPDAAEPHDGAVSRR